MLAAAALAAAAAAPASAITLRACVADTAQPGCDVLPRGSLAGPSALAVSPDGRRVHVAAYGAGSVLTFGRGLDLRRCATSCAAPPPYALDGSAGLAVDRTGVFAVSGLGRSLSRLTPGGAFVGCVADGGRNGCADPAHDALAGAGAVAVAGRDAYVTAFDGAAVSHFRGGALVDCVADAGSFGCAATPRNVLEGASAVAIRGRDVYVTAFRSGALVRFRRGAAGRLAYRGCIADDGANGCVRAVRPGLDAASAVAVSPDGRRVLVAAQTGAVSAYARSPRTGALRFSTRSRAGVLAGASGLAVRGADVYVAAPGADAITRLTGARLRVAGCVARRRDRCRRGPPGALRGVYALAVRGRDLYAASPASASVSSFMLSNSR